MQKEVGTSIYRTAKYKLLSLLQESGVEILTQHALAGVGEGTVELKQLPGGETVSVDADIVIMALGNRPDKAYEDKLAAAFDKVVVVGDATRPALWPTPRRPPTKSAFTSDPMSLRETFPVSRSVPTGMLLFCQP